MAKGPYSRLYHSLIDEYPRVWHSDLALGRFMRLLVIAEKWYPQWVPAPKRDPIYKMLVDCGVIIEKTETGSMARSYSVRGLDKERGRRSEHATRAASMRWASSEDAESMLKKEKEKEKEQEQSKERAEKARASDLDSSDPFDAYVLAVGRAPSPTAIEWLGNLSRDHGDALVGQTILSQWQASPRISTLLSRVETALARAARQRDKQRTTAETSRINGEARRLDERRAKASPEERAQQETFRKALKIGMNGGPMPIPDTAEGARRYVADWERTHGTVT